MIAKESDSQLGVGLLISTILISFPPLPPGESGVKVWRDGACPVSLETPSYILPCKGEVVGK